MGAPEWLTHVFCPVLGLIITTVMWSSPLKEILKARKSRDLGTINPVPGLITILNCIGWLIYSLMKKDFFIFWGNLPGLLIGLFSTITSMTILAQKTKPNEPLSQSYLNLEYFVLFAFSFWCIMALLSVNIFNSFPESEHQPQLFIGYISTCFAICYYASPMSTLYEVIRSGDTSSMYAPMIVCNLANSLLWTAYGFGIDDVNVFVPNALGLLLSSIQILVLVALYRPKNAAAYESAEKDTQKRIEIYN